MKMLEIKKGTLLLLSLLFIYDTIVLKVKDENNSAKLTKLIIKQFNT